MINFAIVGMGHIANKHIESIQKVEGLASLQYVIQTLKGSNLICRV